MKYLSQIFQPLITIPKNAVIKSTEITCASQKMFLECGLVRPTSSGLFTLLPLAKRALDKLEAIVRSTFEEIGAQPIAFPSLTAAVLWETSGRFQDCKSELLQLEDRHNRRYLLAPTHEEAVASLLADVGTITSKQLPIILYQISSKYRDELRPKHGLLRAREFTMLDAYSAHETAECARASYDVISAAYVKLFKRIGVEVHKVEAPSGDMGGSLSHEWHLPHPSGEDTLYICTGCSKTSLTRVNSCEACGGEFEGNTSIEVGHTFVLGDRYTGPLKALGPLGPLQMCCYGVGLSRLLAGAPVTAPGLRWPAAIAPYEVLVIGPKEGSKEWSQGAWELTKRFLSESTAYPELMKEILVDDRHAMTVGKRMMQAERMGYPLVVVCGKAATGANPLYEVHVQSLGPKLEPRFLDLSQLMEFLRCEWKERIVDVD